MPPVTSIIMRPSVPLAQEGLMVLEEPPNGAISASVVVNDKLHPLWSITVPVYVPDVIPSKVLSVVPLLQM